MDWSFFKEQYIIEVVTRSTIDIEFSDNTPLYSADTPRIDFIANARVLDKKTFEVKREYPIELSTDEIRQVDNKLRRLIKRDFQIVEVGSEKHSTIELDSHEVIKGVS